MSDPSLPPVVQQPPSSATGVYQHAADADRAADQASEGIASNRPLVLGILFGVTGALGLPLLWYSPAFTRKEKWLWSIVNSLYTLGLVAIAIAALKVIFNAFAEFR